MAHETVGPVLGSRSVSSACSNHNAKSLCESLLRRTIAGLGREQQQEKEAIQLSTALIGPGLYWVVW